MTRGLWLMGVLALGCETRIQHGLDERQANELVAVLTEHQLAPSKVSLGGRTVTWAVEVPDGQAVRAVGLLAKLGLPRTPPPGFREVYGNGALVPSPMEERALYLHALAGELSRTLEGLEGVLSARVHLAPPAAPRPGQPPGEGKASAFLRVRPGAIHSLGPHRDELRALIAGSVEGVRPEAVTLVLSGDEEPLSPPAEEGPKHPGLPPAASLVGAMFCCLSAGLLVVGWRLRWRRLHSEATPVHALARAGQDSKGRPPERNAPCRGLP